ncbi:MAG: D-sedoheptulose 7-phosphate isomerase [Verrucomicrobia bacterium]|nr:D-sedoheptulose 7-phosphate isomerase [Verrucomicrobiota bacterium]
MDPNLFSTRLTEHLDVMRALETQAAAFLEIARIASQAIQSGAKICFMGNGGSAADSQHLAAELVGRFQRERAALPSIALTTDSSILTAVANDYGYEAIFSRQIEGLCRPGDVIIGLSTSGNSANVLRGIDTANRMGLTTIGFSGGTGGKLAQMAQHVLIVPSPKAARVQEAHIFIGHTLCEAIENQTAPPSSP